MKRPFLQRTTLFIIVNNSIFLFNGKKAKESDGPERDNMDRLHTYIINYNGEILLPYVLQHYSTFSDRIILLDNYSTDKSCLIATTFPKVDISILEPKGRHDYQEIMKAKNHRWKASRGKARWVAVVDLDELIYHPNLPAILDDPSGCGIIKCVGYNMVSNAPPSGNKPIIEQIRMGRRAGNYDKAALFRPDEVVEMNYGEGCHGFHPTGNTITHSDIVKLLHYKFLGVDYLLDRNTMTVARIQDDNTKNAGSHFYGGKEQAEIDMNGAWFRAYDVVGGT